MKTNTGRKIIGLFIVSAILAAMPKAVLAAGFLSEVETAAGTGELGFQDGSAEEALFSFPYGMAKDKDGGLIIVDSYNNRIRLLKGEQVTTLAGTSDKKDDYGFYLGGFADGAALEARFNRPRGAVVDSNGNIFISDSGNNCIRIITAGKVYTFAGTSKAGYTDAAGSKARFHLPSGMAMDSNDNLYVADTLNNVIRKISPLGNVTTFAGVFTEIGGYQDGKAGQSLFNEPTDIAVDQAGTVYVLDSGNQRVRKIKDGVVSTIAGISTESIPDTSYAKGGFKNGIASEAMFNFPMGLEVTEDGTIFIADTWNYRIRVIKPDGRVSTLTGSGNPGLQDGYADEAQFNGPAGLLYDNGTLYISDMWNNCIRTMKVEAAKVQAIVDRSDIEKSYQFGEITDEISVWLNGSRLKFSDAKPYKEDKKIYIPLKTVFEAWKAQVRWIYKIRKVEVKKEGFYQLYEPGLDATFFNAGDVYISSEGLGSLANFRVEWFPEYNALVIEERD